MSAAFELRLSASEYVVTATLIVALERLRRAVGHPDGPSVPPEVHDLLNAYIVGAVHGDYPRPVGEPNDV